MKKRRRTSREAGDLPAAMPGPDHLPIQAKPPGGSVEPPFGCIARDGETALNSVMISLGDLQRRQVRGRDRRHRFPLVPPLMMACDSSSFGEPILSTRYFSMERAGGQDPDEWRSANPHRRGVFGRRLASAVGVGPERAA